jgi:hypothetical protein
VKYQIGDYEATHPSPIWRDRSNFVFAAFLGINDGRAEWEQLWGYKLAPKRFILCCIPFFVRNVALGDEVETDDDFVLQKVICRSGQVTFRVWFGGQNAFMRQGIITELAEIAPQMEWSSENLLALSASEEESQDVANFLHGREKAGLLKYETGRD